MKNPISKLFVLDTNVILNDSRCFFNLGVNDIVIPLVVIAELDKFKNGSEDINYHARTATKIIDEFCEKGDAIFTTGVEIMPGLGKMSIQLMRKISKKIEENFPTIDADTQIINLAYCLSQETERQVVIISKDANLRVRARSVGIKAEDYLNDKIKDEGILSEVIQTLNIDPKVIARLYEQHNAKIDYRIDDAIPNQCFILKNGSQSVLAKYRDGVLHRVANKNHSVAMHITPRNSEQLFAMDALLDPYISLVTIEGIAGTGKTIVSLACGLEQLKSDLYEHLLFTRQTVSVGNREIGFLPGDVEDKIHPFMSGLYDNLGVIKAVHHENANLIKEYTDQKKIVIEPLSFIRGRSLHQAFIIIDESQNLTRHEAKTIITRAGEGTKIILIGDTGQIDSPYLDRRSNGLSYVIEKFKGQPCHSHFHLIKGERSPLATLAGELL